MNGTTCPRCRRELRTLPAGCPCGADLSALRRLADLADRHYNDGIVAARSGRWADASEHLAVALALNPDDVEATVAAARVARRQGRPDRVAALVEHAGRLAPGRPDLDELLTVVADRADTDTDAGTEAAGPPTATGKQAARTSAGSGSPKARNRNRAQRKNNRKPKGRRGGRQ